MTKIQKDIIQKLLEGYNVYGNPSYGFRLRSPEMHAHLRFGIRTFYKIRPLLRKSNGVFLINKSKVRQLHGKTFTKRQYKAILKSKPIKCQPCTQPQGSIKPIKINP